jgi:hypothetical protein
MRLIIFAIYLGIGAMLHALFIGPQFDWSSAWTFGWLFGWPIMLVITGGVFIVGGVVVGTMITSLWMWLSAFANWREMRRVRATAKQRKSA